VDIPKKSGGYRRIVIATVRDRVAQTAALQALHPQVEPLLHPSAFAYRTGLGVQDALARVCALRDQASPTRSGRTSGASSTGCPRPPLRLLDAEIPAPPGVPFCATGSPPR
jgi:hypothetical protein